MESHKMLFETCFIDNYIVAELEIVKNVKINDKNDNAKC